MKPLQSWDKSCHDESGQGGQHAQWMKFYSGARQETPQTKLITGGEYKTN